MLEGRKRREERQEKRVHVVVGPIKGLIERLHQSYQARRGSYVIQVFKSPVHMLVLT